MSRSVPYSAVPDPDDDSSAETVRRGPLARAWAAGVATLRDTELRSLGALTVCLAGVTFAYSLQIAFLTPFFRELGISAFWASVIWTGGPIAGLLVQPIIGVISDRTSGKWGRRRPYILAGAVLVVACEQLVSNARDAAAAGSDVTPATRQARAVGLAVAGFWLMDVSNNAIQGPVRALLADFAGTLSQSRGSAFFSLWVGLGNVLGYACGYVRWGEVLPFFRSAACESGCADIRAAYTIGGVVILTLALVTVLTTRETPLSVLREREQQEQEQEAAAAAGATAVHADPDEVVTVERPNLLVAVGRGLVSQPRWFAWLNAVQFFAWFGWFSVFMYATDWVGVDVMGGLPADPCPPLPADSPCQLYEQGVRLGSLAMAAQSLVCLLISPIMPRLFRWVGMKRVFMVGQLVFALSLCATVLVRSRGLAVVIIALLGLSLACVMIIPYAIIGNLCPAADAGLFMGVRNVIVCCAQLLAALLLGSLVKGVLAGNVAWALFIGGAFAAGSALLVPKLSTGEEREARRLAAAAAVLSDAAHAAEMSS